MKYEDYPLRRQQEDAPKELDSQLTQLENTNRIEAMRYRLEEVCLQVATDLQSADDQLKKLVLDPLQPEITVTGQKPARSLVPLGLPLGLPLWPGCQGLRLLVALLAVVILHLVAWLLVPNSQPGNVS